MRGCTTTTGGNTRVIGGSRSVQKEKTAPVRHKNGEGGLGWGRDARSYSETYTRMPSRRRAATATAAAAARVKLDDIVLQRGNSAPSALSLLSPPPSMHAPACTWGAHTSSSGFWYSRAFQFKHRLSELNLSTATRKHQWPPPTPAIPRRGSGEGPADQSVVASVRHTVGTAHSDARMRMALPCTISMRLRPSNDACAVPPRRSSERPLRAQGGACM
jgi:hypothetical protein